MLLSQQAGYVRVTLQRLILCVESSWWKVNKPRLYHSEPGHYIFAGLFHYIYSRHIVPSLSCPVVTMKLLLLGATGPTGQQLVQEALAQGHHVLALVRNPEKLTTQNEKLTVIKADIFETSQLASHMSGCDAVLSALGGRAGWNAPCDVYTRAGTAVVAAMRQTGVQRLIVVTAWGTKDDPNLPFLYRWVFKPTLLKNVIKDMELFEDFLLAECQDINYTIVRPPRLTNNPSTGAKLLAQSGQSIAGKGNGVSRQDVAKFMLQCLSTQEFDRAMVAVAYDAT